MKKTRIIALVAISLMAVTLLAGCAGTEQTTADITYLKATATKAGINFSFEYPDSYVKATPDAFEDTGGDDSLTLNYKDPESIGGKADIQIYIIVCPPIAGRPDANTWTEEHIEILEKSDEDFALYENSAIEVAGISGKKIVYFTKILGSLNEEEVVIRDAYLDYRGYVWKLTVLSVVEMSDQAEPVFEHLIETFKFLD